MSGHTRLAVAGAAVVAVVAVAAALAPLLAPHAPHAPAGAPLQPPSAAHWLGTTDVGQDVWSQLVWGARAALIVAVAAAALSVAVGVTVGVAAGLVGGLVDVACMRLVDVVLALPALPLVLVIVAFAGPSRVTLVAVIAVFSWPWTARVVAADVRRLRGLGFVRAAAGFGEPPWQVGRRHILPAIAPLAAAGFAEVASVAVIVDAGLAFLGLADPTTPSWGLMLNRASTYPGWYASPMWTWWLVPPAAMVTVTVVALTFASMGVAAHHQHTPTAEPTRT